MTDEIYWMDNKSLNTLPAMESLPRRKHTHSGSPSPAPSAPDISHAPKISLCVPPPLSNRRLSDRCRTVTWRFEWATRGHLWFTWPAL